MQFTDTQFMSAAQKGRVLKQWQRFVKGGFKPSGFTKDLYSHLHLHFDFIAHYDRMGFYGQRFLDAYGLLSTLEGIDAWCACCTNVGDYADINHAMADVVRPHLKEITRQALRRRKDELTIAMNQMATEMMQIDHELIGAA